MTNYAINDLYLSLHIEEGVNIQLSMLRAITADPVPSGGGGGALNFFQVGVCGLDFRSVGLAN